MKKSTQLASWSCTGGKSEESFFGHFDKDKIHIRNVTELNIQLNSEPNKKDQENQKMSEPSILDFIAEYKPKKMIFDIPLSQPLCATCDLLCPGMELCPKKSFVEIRLKIEELLKEDHLFQSTSPKRYEREREELDLVKYNYPLLDKRTDVPLLSRSFKRKLRRGVLPYWNRPLDFWIWMNYFDAWLKIFGSSYDSFGQSSPIHWAQMTYWKKHFPQNLALYETMPQLVLLELHRGNILSKKKLLQLFDFDQAPFARLDTINTLSELLGFQMTEATIDNIVRYPRAFNSALLLLALMQEEKGKYFDLSHSAFLMDSGNSHFLVSHFLQN